MVLWILAIIGITGQVEDRITKTRMKWRLKRVCLQYKKMQFTMKIYSACYERLIPLGKKNGLILKGGFLIWDPIIPVVESTFVTGGN